MSHPCPPLAAQAMQAQQGHQTVPLLLPQKHPEQDNILHSHTLGQDQNAKFAYSWLPGLSRVIMRQVPLLTSKRKVVTAFKEASRTQ